MKDGNPTKEKEQFPASWGSEYVPEKHFLRSLSKEERTMLKVPPKLDTPVATLSKLYQFTVDFAGQVRQGINLMMLSWLKSRPTYYT